MNQYATRIMSAATILLNKRGRSENLKEQALELARMYDGNVKIQIDVDQRTGSAVVQVTEYGL